MKKILFYLFLFTNILFSNATGEIAYIDINYILKTSEVGKYLNSHISKKKRSIFKKIRIN